MAAATKVDNSALLMLLDRSNNIYITQAVLLAAASRSRDTQDTEVLRFILEKSDNIQITEDASWPQLGKQENPPF